MTRAEFLDTRYHYRATCIAVHDGDTITCSLDLGCYVALTLKLRLLGINAPEVVGESRAAGLAARDALAAMVMGKTVYLVTVKDRTEKYGRLLAQVFADLAEVELTDVNQRMVEMGHAQPYMV